MTQEVPDWLKRSTQALQKDSVVYSRTTNNTDRDIENWTPIAENIYTKTESWYRLEINRIFAEISEHLIGEFSQSSWKGPRTFGQGFLCLKDRQGSYRPLKTPVPNIEDKPKTMRGLTSELLEIGNTGILTSEVGFGHIEGSVSYQESYHDSEYGNWSQTVSEYLVRLDSEKISLIQTDNNNILLSLQLSGISSPKDLEKELDKYFSEKLEAKRAKETLMIETKKRKDRILNLLSSIKFDEFMKLNSFTTENLWLNIDEENKVKFQPWITEWTSGKDTLVVKLCEVPLTSRNKIIEKYSLLIITNEGKIGIPTYDKKISTRDVSEFPVGGRGFQAKSQINQGLEEIIRKLKKNPQFSQEKPIPPDTGGWGER